MTTKVEVMKRLARSMTKAFKAQGHQVPHGAVLNALAAAGGSFNWHVFVKKAEAQGPLATAAAQTSVWVGLHDHKRGNDIYVGRSQEDVFAIKRGLALENIDTEYPEYKDDGPMSDEQKVAYYWDAASEASEEWFGICQYDIEPSVACEATTSSVAPTKASGPEIASMLIASTAHVTEAEAKVLDEAGCSRGDYGWLLHVGGSRPVPSEIGEPSEGLRGAIEQARRTGCAYLLLDRDADQLDGVATYSW